MNWRCRVFSGFLARAIFRQNLMLLNFKNCQCYCKKLMNWFPWSVLLSTIERTSECSKRLVSVNHTTAARGCEHFDLQWGIWPDWNANKISQAVDHSGNDQYIKNFLEVICQKIKFWACLSRGKPRIIFSLWFTLQIFLWVVVQCILFLSWPRRG